MANKTVYTSQQARALCDLFKAMPMALQEVQGTRYPVNEQLKRGLLFVDEKYQPVEANRNLFHLAADLYGIDPEVMTNTFYKSFKTVTEKSRFEIFVDQVIHYMGTYGMESLGHQPLTIVPVQELEVPEVDLSRIQITVIRLLNDGQVVNLVNSIGENVTAPSERITDAFKVLVSLLDMPLDEIRSFELACIACDWFNEPPKNGKSFLRYLVYKATGSTLVVNNQRTVRAIKNAPDTDAFYAQMFAKADLVSLASIFLRYKNLFLAFKTKEGCASTINKLRRMAGTYHKPLSDVAVQNYISLALAGNRGDDLQTLRLKMSPADLVKVINAMLGRIHAEDGDPAVYNIRNGRTFVESDAMIALDGKSKRVLQDEIGLLFWHLAGRIRTVVTGKTFFIPEYIQYAVPHSQKQFIGNLPWGTTIRMPGEHPAATIGVSWTNQGKDGRARVDLDLHAMTPNHHYGWNSSFSDEKGDIIYTGDMTNAPLPLGAAEAYWVSGVDEPVLFNLNKYAGPDRVPFKLYLSAVKPNYKMPSDHLVRSSKPYTMDPNELVIPPIPMVLNNSNATLLGFWWHGEFVFFSGNVSNSAVPRGDYKSYLRGIIKNQTMHLSMTELLKTAGAEVIDNVDDLSKAYENGVEVISLSPDTLAVDTLLNLVNGILPQ